MTKDSSDDPLLCTRDYKEFFLVTFDLILDWKKNGYNLSPESWTNTLKPMQDFHKDCYNVDFDFVKYNDCVVEVASVLPFIGDLVHSYHEKNLSDVILESSKIAIDLLNGFSLCHTIAS